MSLLSDTQGRPEGVWSLLRLLDALGGRAPRDDVDRWMMPVSFRSSDKSISHVSQTVGCARSLGMVADEARDLTLALATVPQTIEAFSDLVHQRLIAPPNQADGIVLKVYACVVLQTTRTGGTNWLAEQTIPDIASDFNRVLMRGEDGDDRVFNQYKAAPWREWIIAMGLGFAGGGKNALPYLFPQPAARLLRELPALADDLGVGVEIPAATFMHALAQRMPYLDGGTTYTHVASLVAEEHGWQPRAGWISNVLSEALRDLHEDGKLSLVARTDAADSLSLSHDPASPLGSFVAVVIRDGACR